MTAWRLDVSTITLIIGDVYYLIEGAVLVWVTWKIFQNLYQCKRKFIFCCPVFSHRHNWLVEPSSSNKIYALLSTTMLLFSSVMFIPISIPAAEQSPIHSADILTLVGEIGRIFYFFYLISTLEYQMKQEALIRNMFSPKWIIVLKLVQYLSLLPIAVIWIFYFVPGAFDPRYLPYDLANYAVLMILRVCSEMLLGWIHFKGLNQVCTYWKSKDWQEYEQYGGETQKIHEILNSVTRSAVVIVGSFIATTACILTNLYRDYCGGYCASDALAYAVANVATLLDSIDDITYALSIYFIYEFGYNDYRTCCGKCHASVYDYFQNRLQKQSNMQVNDTCCECRCCRRSPVAANNYLVLNN